MTGLPAEIAYGKVVGRWILAVADTPTDADKLPEAKVPTGTVKFTRKVANTSLLDTTQDDGTYVGIARQSVTADLDDATGEIHLNGDTELGVWLVEGDYIVEPIIANVTWPKFDITVTAAHTEQAPLDLISWSPPPAPPAATVLTMQVPSTVNDGYLLARSGNTVVGVDPATLGGAAPVASETVAGIVELATPAETAAGEDGVRATTPAGVKAALDAKAASDMSTYVAQANLTVTPGASVSGSNTGDEPAASTTVKGVVKLATTAEATTGTDTTRAVTPAGVAAAIAGVGGGVTDHGALSGLADDDHTQYALADGTRGMFAATSHTHTASQISDSTTTGRSLITAATATAARTAISAAPALGSDDNYVTGAEKAALHTHPAVIAQGATQADARAAIGAGTSDLAIGTTGTTAAAGNDSRIVNAVPSSRTVAGKALSSDVTIGAADLSATGTRDATTVLHGDDTWKVPAGGGGAIGGDAGPLPPPIYGTWHTGRPAESIAVASQAWVGSDIATATVIYVPVSGTLDRLGCTVLTAATAATIRLAIYTWDLGLVADSGALDASTTGNKVGTVSATISAGWHIFVAKSAPGGVSVRGWSAYWPIGQTDIHSSNTIQSGSLTRGETSGAFPGTLNLAAYAPPTANYVAHGGSFRITP